MTKNILITGSTGFIGKNIVEGFKDKYTMVTPTHKELDLLNQKDVQDYFKNNDIDTVIHCANAGGTRKSTLPPGRVLEQNTRMFFNLVENQERYRRLINLGSGAEYNKYRPLIKVSETEFGTSIPPEDYGFSKYLVSKHIEKTCNMYSLRLFGIFGKYEDYEYKFISNAIVKNLFHLPITIRQNVKFSWVYINDFLKILDLFVSRTPHYTAYNITLSPPTDLITIAQSINSLSDYESEIITENDGLNFEYSGNNTRLKEYVNGMPFTSMESAIKELVTYYSAILPTINRDAIQADVYAAQCNVIKRWIK